MRIKCAAIRYKDKIYEGESHPKIGLKMLEDGVCERPYPGGKAQGFVTDKGLFVSRKKALMIAARAKQVTIGRTQTPHELFSEDLRNTK